MDNFDPAHGFAVSCFGCFERADLAQYERRNMGLFQDIWPANDHIQFFHFAGQVVQRTRYT